MHRFFPSFHFPFSVCFTVGVCVCWGPCDFLPRPYIIPSALDTFSIPTRSLTLLLLLLLLLLLPLCMMCESCLVPKRGYHPLPIHHSSLRSSLFLSSTQTAPNRFRDPNHKSLSSIRTTRTWYTRKPPSALSCCCDCRPSLLDTFPTIYITHTHARKKRPPPQHPHPQHPIAITWSAGSGIQRARRRRPSHM
jgi:hypothetical protein